MTDITLGSILIESQAHPPNAVWLRSEPDASGWISLNGTRPAFDEQVRGAGWTFFFMAGLIKTTVFGFDRQKTLRVALRRLIRNVKSHNCNAIEIAEVTAKSFLKLPYVSVSAHARHLQKGRTFHEPIPAGSI
ncbi:MAG: hypothetical protein ABSH50_14790 [Bryobacteraceae bacterium]|jgi:hypothetical protein